MTDEKYQAAFNLIHEIGDLEAVRHELENVKADESARRAIQDINNGYYIRSGMYERIDAAAKDAIDKEIDAIIIEISQQIGEKKDKFYSL